MTSIKPEFCIPILYKFVIKVMQLHYGPNSLISTLKSDSVFNRNFGIQLWSLQEQNLNFYYTEKLQYDTKNTK